MLNKILINVIIFNNIISYYYSIQLLPILVCSNQ